MYVMNEIQNGRNLVEIVNCITKPIKCMKVKAWSDSSKSLTVDFEWIWMIWDNLNHFWYHTHSNTLGDSRILNAELTI